jgi:hypothetical protein
MPLKDNYNTGDSLGASDFNTVVSQVNRLSSFASTATSGGTLTLTSASARTQEFTGSANHTLVLPTTGVEAGTQIIGINNSSGTITTLSSNMGVIHVLGPSIECMFTALVADPTLPEHWEDSFFGSNFAAGKVLNVNTTLTLAGTDGTTFTFPGASDTVTTIAATQSLSNKTLTAPTITNYTESVVTIGTVTTAATLSLTSGTVLTATLTASTACTFTMPAVGAGKSFILLLKQAPTTGNGSATFTNVKWTSVPTITVTPGKMDILSFVSDGVNWYGSVSAGYTP